MGWRSERGGGGRRSRRDRADAGRRPRIARRGHGAPPASQRAGHRPRLRDDRPHRTIASRACRSAAPARRSSAVTSRCCRRGARHHRSVPTSARRSRASLKDIPPGDYFVQGFVNVYSEFKRVRRPHGVDARRPVGRPALERLAGQSLQRGRSACTSVRPTETIKLVADQKIPAVQVPADTAWVKRFKIQSPMLTKFWGRPIYLGATVLLPRDYDTLDDAAIRSSIGRAIFRSRRHWPSRRATRFTTGVDPRRLPAHDRRHAAAPDAVLRRQLRRELGEQRSVRRRDHAGARCPRSKSASASSASRGRGSPTADPPAAGFRSRIRFSIRTSTAASGRTAPTR